MISKHKTCRFEDAVAVDFPQPPRISYVQTTSEDDCGVGVGGCLVPPGGSNQNHVHTASETIHVTEGELEFVFPSETITLKARDAIVIPAGEWHQIFNRTDKPAYHTYVFSDPACTDLIIKRYNQEK